MKGKEGKNAKKGGGGIAIIFVQSGIQLSLG
jgi:hypothetical protein